MFNKMPRLCAIASLTALFGIAAASQVSAQIVFDGGAPDPTHSNGNEMTQWIQAQPFALAAPTTLTGVHFWDIEGNPGFSGSVHWLVYADAAGSPGAVIGQGDATTVSHVATGNVAIGLTEFSDDFSLAGPSLAAGNFWLGLHNGPLSNQARSEMYWESNFPDNGNGQELIAPFTGRWFGNSSGHAFNIRGGDNAVPEPGSMALLAGLGVTGSAIGVSRLRRRRK